MSQFEMYALIAVVAVGALALVAVALAVRGALAAVKGRAAKRAAAGRVAKAAVAVLCIVAIVASNWATTTYAAAINNVFTKTGSAASADDGGETTETTEEDWYNTAYSIAEEGMVLLKNEDSALPLSAGEKINLLGYYAYNPYYSGSGSGSVSASDSIDVATSLTDAGFELNPALESLYPTVEAEESSVGFDSGSLVIDEIGIDSYTGDASFDSLAAYSGTAVVVIGRSGGEGYDLTDYSGGDYLELTQDEQDLLAASCEAFDKVIVVLNCANALNMDVLSTYDVDAMIWAGLPGPYGFKALGEILAGTVNPSGKLPDTWVYDADSAPANENYGTQEATNASGRYYVDYVEGIYVGYKWYETAYAEGAVITNTTTGETFDYSDYESVVAYPFGYGLSYTEFEQEITGGLEEGAELTADGTVEVEVTVTNTGSVAGKSVAQLYVTSPYTSYDQQNGVEKAEVALVAYGKTQLLEPGDSETLTLSVAVEDLASYDSSHANSDGTQGCYLLDEGDYVFSLRSDAHTVVDEVTATMAEQHFFEGENQRSTDEQTVQNQFSDAARGEYLSRADGFANYESAMASVSPTIEDDTYATTDNLYDSSYDDVVTEALVEGEDYDAEGTLTLADMEGLDYDDPQWDSLISQLSVKELEEMVTDTLYSDPELKSIDRSATVDADGPLGISSMFVSDMQGIAYPCVPLLAATFNVELAEQMGSTVADQAASLGTTAWYAPAMDIHRSSYSGRNFEYYSEDSLLSGLTAAAEVKGARDKGLTVFIKHFALNDQESQRDSVHTYANEQAIREIYLRPFEYAVKDGGATGVMTSMNYIGDVYAGGHAGLITEVLRGEWGFQGTVLTDMDQAGEARSAKACMRAGADKWLSVSISTDVVEAETDADIYYLQRAAHNILYTQANAARSNVEVANWHVYLYVLWAELALIAVAAAGSIAADVAAGKKRAAA